MSSRPVYLRVSSGNSTHDSTHAISGCLSQHVSRSEPTIVSLAHPALERRLPRSTGDGYSIARATAMDSLLQLYSTAGNWQGNGDGLAAFGSRMYHARAHSSAAQSKADTPEGPKRAHTKQS